MELIAIGPLICGLILAVSCLTGLDGTPTADGVPHYTQENVTIIAKNSHSISIQWEQIDFSEPEKGEYGYKVTCWPKGDTPDSQTRDIASSDIHMLLSVTFTSLAFYTFHHLKVTPYRKSTHTYGTPYPTLLTETLCVAPSPPLDVTVKTKQVEGRDLENIEVSYVLPYNINCAAFGTAYVSYTSELSGNNKWMESSRAPAGVPVIFSPSLRGPHKLRLLINNYVLTSSSHILEVTVHNISANQTVQMTPCQLTTEQTVKMVPRQLTTEQTVKMVPRQLPTKQTFVSSEGSALVLWIVIGLLSLFLVTFIITTIIITMKYKRLKAKQKSPGTTTAVPNNITSSPHNSTANTMSDNHTTVPKTVVSRREPSYQEVQERPAIANSGYLTTTTASPDNNEYQQLP